MKSTAKLEQQLTQPSPRLIHDMSQLDGDLLILGAGGKMGPSLAVLAKRAIAAAGLGHRVVAVSRFSADKTRRSLEEQGVETIAADLLTPEAVSCLPEVPNVIYMAGQKFGTDGSEAITWAQNTWAPGLVAHRYRAARIVVFSTGNVYPLRPLGVGGADEDTAPAPIGEYAQSCLGRERIFEYGSRRYNTPVLQYRLNYAMDLRYGVLVDIARMVKENRPVDLAMGTINVIWQGDANEYALRCLQLCRTPPAILNVTGPELVSVRWLAKQFGQAFGTEPLFSGTEGPDALISNASRCHGLLGYPHVSLRTMIDWTVQWIEARGETLDKPTHFQERKGRY